MASLPKLLLAQAGPSPEAVDTVVGGLERIAPLYAGAAGGAIVATVFGLAFVGIIVLLLRSQNRRDDAAQNERRHEREVAANERERIATQAAKDREQHALLVRDLLVVTRSPVSGPEGASGSHG